MLVRLFIILLIGSLTFFASNSQVYAHNSATQTNSNYISNTSKDGEIIAFFIVLNNNEIAAAKKALAKVKNTSVKDFANKMIKDHGDNLKKLTNLSKQINIKPIYTVEVIDLKKAGKTELNKLSNVDQEKFDKSYIDAMVTGHEQALKNVEKDETKVQNSELKNYLSQTKSAVEEHLRDAQSIQKSL